MKEHIEYEEFAEVDEFQVSKDYEVVIVKKLNKDGKWVIVSQYICNYAASSEEYCDGYSLSMTGFNGELIGEIHCVDIVECDEDGKWVLHLR